MSGLFSLTKAASLSLCGMFFRLASSVMRSSTDGVTVVAGETAFTMIPCFPYAFERLLVRLMSAALDAL